MIFLAFDAASLILPLLFKLIGAWLVTSRNAKDCRFRSCRGWLARDPDGDAATIPVADDEALNSSVVDAVSLLGVGGSGMLCQ